MNAIIYTSNTGTTKEYAELLGHHTGLPVYSLKKAKDMICNGANHVGEDNLKDVLNWYNSETHEA